MKLILKQMNSIKKLFNQENKSSIICFLSILLIAWMILYFIPELFTTLFETVLGNLILLTVSVLALSFNFKYGILITIIFIIIYRFGQLIINKKTNNGKEGFIWNHPSTQDFLLLQNTINPQVVFDVNMIQKSQASQEELDYFNKYQKWPWSEKTKELYLKAIKSNPFVRVSPESSLNYSMTVYNESAMLMLLSYQTKEGQFLLNGVLVKDPSGNKMEDVPNGFGNFAYTSGQMENLSDNIIKCNMDTSGNPTLEKITYTGRGGIFGQQTSTNTPVDYNDLENIIPGFTFLNQPCNPCGAINETPDYSCPFKLEVKNKPPFVSDIFQYLWNISDNPLQSMPSFLNENINPDEFPILSELQSELIKQNTYISQQ
jgi:hypothetical protein